MFVALGDEHRQRIVLMFEPGEHLNVGQIVAASTLSRSAVAHHLKVLREAGVVHAEKIGKEVWYRTDPQAVQSKLASKTRGLRSLVGEHVVAALHIDNVPDLGDIKTAWDHIHAEGFLGSRITMQTIWSAYDSMLAAPLVLDLARLLALADAAGEAGVVPELGFFFKDPGGSDVHDFGQQTTELIEWARATGARLSTEARPVGAAR